METAIVYWGSIGIMENKMETIMSFSAMLPREFGEVSSL